MDTEILSQRIAERLAILGKTERSASIEATGGPDAIRYSRTRNSMPSVTRLVALAHVLDTSTAYLMGSTDDSESDMKKLPSGNVITDAAVDQAYSITSITGQKLGYTLSCYSELAEPRTFDNITGSTVDVQVVRLYSKMIEAYELPSVFFELSCMGLRLPTNSLSPAFEEGKPFIISLASKAKVGDYCAFFLSIVSKMGGGEDVFGEAFFGKLLGLTETYATVSQLNPPTVLQIPRAEIKRVSPGLTLEDLLTKRGTIAAREVDAAYMP